MSPRLAADQELVESFRKLSLPLMRADTQFSVVEASLKGYQKWVAAHGRSPQHDVGNYYLAFDEIFIDSEIGTTTNATGAYD